MRKKHFYFFAIALLITVLNVCAQDFRVPQPSTKQVITQDFGLGTITLTYSRPNVKVVPYSATLNLITWFGELEPITQQH